MRVLTRDSETRRGSGSRRFNARTQETSRPSLRCFVGAAATVPEEKRYSSGWKKIPDSYYSESIHKFSSCSAHYVKHLLCSHYCNQLLHATLLSCHHLTLIYDYVRVRVKFESNRAPRIREKYELSFRDVCTLVHTWCFVFACVFWL